MHKTSDYTVQLYFLFIFAFVHGKRVLLKNTAQTIYLYQEEIFFYVRKNCAFTHKFLSQKDQKTYQLKYKLRSFLVTKYA